MGERSACDIPVSQLMLSRVVTADVDDDAGRALRLLGGEPTPCVVVLRDGVPVGAVTLRDLGIVCAIHWPRLDAAGLRVGQVMSAPVVRVRPETPLSELLPLLDRSEIECLVVMRDDELLGILDRRRVLRACIRLLAR